MKPGAVESSEADEQSEARRRDDDPPRRTLLCSSCRQPITSKGAATEVDGAHGHTFFNPAGLLFEIGCFFAAPGCVVSGDPTTEFSWFSGYSWRYASCAGCSAHLGWQFLSSEAASFFGLIRGRLIEEVGEQPL